MKTSQRARAIAVVWLSFAAAISSLRADSATWLQNPADGNWNNAANWTAGGPPNGSSDEATFAVSNQTKISLSAATEVGGINFSFGAGPFTISVGPVLGLTIGGAGIFNGSVTNPNFETVGGSANGQSGGIIIFSSGTAGKGDFVNSAGTVAGSFGGVIQFRGSSNAGSGTFNNKGSTIPPITDPRPTGGATQFYNNSSAGNGLFVTDGGGDWDGLGGLLQFYDNSTAGHAILVTNGGNPGGGITAGGTTEFHNSSNAGNATLIVNPSAEHGMEAVVRFLDNSSANFANITVKGAPGALLGNGILLFDGSSTAGNATITAEGAPNTLFAFGGAVSFTSNSTPGNATLIANGGTGIGPGGGIFLSSTNSISTARVAVFGNGSLSCSQQTVGSIEGTGIIHADNLSVGSNNLSTTFSGLIDGGSVSKIGTGTLTLANANTYTDLTTITSGRLQASSDGALGASDVALTMAGAILSLQGGTANNYIFDAGILSVVTGSTVNLNFKGTPDVVGFLVVNGVSQPAGIYGGPASGAPHQLPQFTGAGTILVATPVAISRKLQGATNFDMNLPFTGASSIECRSGGANNAYQIITTFGFPVTFNNATITSGTGNIANVTGNGTATVTINLIGVTNAQTLTVTLSGMNYGVATGDLPIRMGVLIGDTNGNGSVNASDVSQTKAQAGQPITSSNFREDVNGNGVINASDVAFVKSKSGTSLPFVP